MDSLNILLEKAKEFHGDICPGIATGTRMTIAGMRELGMDPLTHNRDLIVYVEIDRCATDAIQAITGCTLGHKTLKQLNYGKFAATFIDTRTGKAVRIATYPKKPDQPSDMNELKEMILTAPEKELFSIQQVSVDIPEGDMPGFPTSITTCSRCGEQIMDGKEVVSNNTLFCKNCVGDSYYKRINAE